VLRILHVLRAPVGGLFRHVSDLAVHQAARGHAVGLFCDRAHVDALTHARLAALEPHLTLGLHRQAMPRLPGVDDWRIARATTEVAGRLEVDVIHGHGAKGGLYARLGGAQHGNRARPVRFYTPHGGSLHYAPTSLNGRLYMTVERWLARRTDGLIFESAFAQTRFASQIGSGLADERVIPNGVGDADFEPVAPAPDAADIVFVGELRHLKGVDVLLDAIADAEVDGRSLTAVIVGAGPDADVIKSRAAELGLSERVRFPGALPARDAFALGRVLAMPSRAESLPYVILEAAAAGRPIVATLVGGIPEITAGTATKLVAAGDPAPLRKALIDTLSAPDVAATRADELRARIAERFSVTRMGDDVLAFYNEAINRVP